MSLKKIGIFGAQTIRLLREKWPNASMLAEELFAMFNATEPINIPADSNLTKSDGPNGSYLNVPDFTFGDTLFSLKGRGGITLGNVVINEDGSTGLSQGGVSVPSTKKKPAAATGVFAGFVQSGTGSTYQVQIFTGGLGGTSQVVQVTQLLIASGQTIPPGTPAIVVLQADGTYIMQVPVWGTPQ